jgi:hypothetical protein
MRGSIAVLSAGRQSNEKTGAARRGNRFDVTGDSVREPARQR